jgi:single-strand DNA-binding protein
MNKNNKKNRNSESKNEIQRVINSKRTNYFRRKHMNNLNSILIEGNLVKDPEMSHTPKGTAFCKFAIASNRFYKMDEEYQKEVSFFTIQTWAKLAEICSEYLKKGRGIRVVGRLKQDRWTGTDGKGKSRIEIIAEHVEFKPDFRTKDKTATSAEQKDELREAVSF